MTCDDTKDNAGLYRYFSDSKTITKIVASFLFYGSHFTGIAILSYVLASRHRSKKK